MATMTAENLSRDPTLIAVRQSERDYLRTNESIPPDWRVWIGFYERQKWAGQWVHTTVPILESRDAALRTNPNTQAITFIVGKLFVHTMSCEYPEYPRDWHWKSAPRANQLLAPIWTHHAVPFPPHYLVVFCACFRLISEHGGHRWSILVSQHGGQHIDFDFHVDVLVSAHC
jgi:hypothetical protein